MSEPASTKVTFVSIAEDRAGQRLDNFLIGHLKGVPKSRIYRIIRDGQVRVNKKRASQTTRLEAGDEVRIPPIRVAEATVAPAVGAGLAERLARGLVYEDDWLLVYNKPAGLAVHGGSGVSLGLIETLRALRPGEDQLELVHRLDRDTSGLIMVARKRSFLRRLQKLMQAGGIEKRYWLLCQGFKGQSRTIEAPLLKLTQGNNERIVRVSREGKASLTEFRLIERLADTQLLEATLGTGRTHQIRVHAQHGGFPLLGDSKYGSASVSDRLRQLGVQRLCLHARSLVLRHPETGQMLTLEAALDEAFEHAIAVLRKEKVG
ncbi:MAG: RluA family pseudouridine synthase [Alcanivoracaceae bacterium]